MFIPFQYWDCKWFVNIKLSRNLWIELPTRLYQQAALLQPSRALSLEQLFVLTLYRCSLLCLLFRKGWNCWAPKFSLGRNAKDHMIDLFTALSQSDFPSGGEREDAKKLLVFLQSGFEIASPPFPSRPCRHSAAQTLHKLSRQLRRLRKTWVLTSRPEKGRENTPGHIDSRAKISPYSIECPSVCFTAEFVWNM